MSNSPPANLHLPTKGDTNRGPRPTEAAKPDVSLPSCAPLAPDEAARSALAGGDPGNTPPANRHLETGGEDTLELSLRVSWGNQWEELVAQMDEAKELAARNDVTLDARQIVDSRDHIYLVDSQGMKPDRTNRSGPHYRWRLHNDGITFGVMRRQMAHPTLPNVLVRVGSLVLMSNGVQVVWDDIQERIAALGGVIVEDKIGRIDPAVDIPGVGVESLSKRFEKGWYVGRARTGQKCSESDNELDRVSTGFNAGKNKCRVRVYDKLKEVQHDTQKLAVLVHRRWGGMPDAAMRVEFQLRREMLRQLRTPNMASWLKGRAGVVAYLCDEWFRVTSRKPDRKNGNTARAKACRQWIRVKEMFEAWAGKSPPAKRSPLPPRLTDHAMVDQALGCLAREAAEAGMMFENGEQFVQWALGRLAERAGSVEIATKVAEKRMELEAYGLVTPQTRRTP